MIPYFILPRFDTGSESFDFIQAADQERARQRQIAQQYFNAGPSVSNLYNAASAYLKSLPLIGISPAYMNPYMQGGTAPTTIAPAKGFTTFQKLSKAAKLQNVKSQIVRKAKAEVRRAAERQATQEQLEQFGNNTAKVIDPYKNYVYNEAERSAAIDFLKENPGMKNSIDTKVIDGYGGGGTWDSFQYHYGPRINKLIPNRKTLGEVRRDNNNFLKTIR